MTPEPGASLTAGRLPLLASLAALGVLATNIMLPAFPAMARKFGVAPGELAWTLSGFFVVFAFGQLFVGPLADAFGRVPVVVGALALVMIAMAAAPGFSPALGTVMTHVFGWRSTFVAVAVAALLVAFHYRQSTGETLPRERRRPAHLGTIARTYVTLAVDPRS